MQELTHQNSLQTSQLFPLSFSLLFNAPQRQRADTAESRNFNLLI